MENIEIRGDKVFKIIKEEISGVDYYKSLEQELEDKQSLVTQVQNTLQGVLAEIAVIELKLNSPELQQFKEE